MKQSIRIMLALAFLATTPLAAMSAEGTVSRAQFTSAVLDREPVDELDSIGPDSDKVFFFTELRNMDGTTITHRWSLNGQLMAEVEFKVRASRWRVYSSKALLPEWRGEWVVDVVDQNGTVLESRNVGYRDAEMTGTEATPMETTSDGAAEAAGAAEPVSVEGASNPDSAAESNNAGGAATEAAESGEPAATESTQQ